MAALSQQHGGGFLFLVPVATNITVTLMDVAHGLNLDDGHDPAHSTLHHQFLDTTKEGGIPQHMAHEHLDALFLCRPCHGDAFLCGLGCRLF